MPSTSLIHRRTGLCPTMATPALQRDGLLFRVSLVGGRVTAQQLRTIADVAADLGSGVIELTNRGNLQIRGIGAEHAEATVERLVTAGFGDATDRIVTVVPFASDRAERLRDAVAAAVRTVDTAGLSGKFVVHVVDGDTAARSSSEGSHADLVLDAATVEPHLAAAQVIALIRACVASGPNARRKDLPSWPVAGAVESNHTLAAEPDDRIVAVPRLGRLDARQLRRLADVIDRADIAHVVITPDKTICVEPAGDEMAAEFLEIGLIADPNDPAADVVACIGSRGCWQTELDTIAMANDIIATLEPGHGLVHISGCEKSCAHSGAAAVTTTFMGRNDSSGFDRIDHR